MCVCVMCVRTVRCCGNTTDLANHLRFNHKKVMSKLRSCSCGPEKRGWQVVEDALQQMSPLSRWREGVLLLATLRAAGRWFIPVETSVCLSMFKQREFPVCCFELSFAVSVLCRYRWCQHGFGVGSEMQSVVSHVTNLHDVERFSVSPRVAAPWLRSRFNIKMNVILSCTFIWAWMLVELAVEFTSPKVKIAVWVFVSHTVCLPPDINCTPGPSLLIDG